MARNFMLTAVAAVLLATSALAQTLDAKAVLAKADAAMGVSKVTSLQISATGYVTALGQNYSSALDETWPRFELKSYTRTIDFPSNSMREDQVRVQGNWNATRGGGQRPIIGERTQHQLVNGTTAWNVNDQNVPAPAFGQGELRQLELLMTPHGFVKAAQAAPDATASEYTESSRTTKKSSVVSFKAFGKYPVNGWINGDGLVTKVQTWMPNPALGDMFVETRLRGQYKDWGNGVKYPTGFHQSIGVPPHPSYDIEISDVKANIANVAQSVPDAVRQATAQPARVAVRQMGPGVWLLGGPYNSMAVEFKDYAVIVEGPMDIERGQAVIDETRRLIPNKPIRFVVNTHHHFDHSGGLRPFGAEDIVVITHESNFNFYEGVLFDLRPRAVAPDRLSLAPRQVHYVLVKDSHRISDGEQDMVIYRADQLEHAEDMLMVYFPKLKLIYQADLYNPVPAGAPQPPVSAQNMNFLYNLERLGLQPETIVSTHTGVHPMADFLKFVGRDKIVSRGAGLNAALNQ